MQLTGKEIIEKNILTNICEQGIQQQGIDVRIDKIFKTSDSGYVPAVGKTMLSHTKEMPYTADGIYELEPGYYEVLLMEGCNIPCDCALVFKTRSSLVRCGAIIHSGQFDAGFKTDHMGCFMHVINKIFIQRNARVAQAIVTQTAEVEQQQLYNGQWQGDRQRDVK